MRNDKLTKEQIIDVINRVPLGYRTSEEHEVLEHFADRIIDAISNTSEDCIVKYD